VLGPYSPVAPATINAIFRAVEGLSITGASVEECLTAVPNAITAMFDTSRFAEINN
jgi:hypothetical protein